MKTIMLKSGREVVEVQREGYCEVLPVSGPSLLTNAEWNEYARQISAESCRNLEAAHIERINRNRALFNQRNG